MFKHVLLRKCDSHISICLLTGSCQWKPAAVIYKPFNFMSTSCEIALKWMPQNIFDDKSTLVPVMAWCHQATSHYLNQCWPRSRHDMASLCHKFCDKPSVSSHSSHDRTNSSSQISHRHFSTSIQNRCPTAYSWERVMEHLFWVQSLGQVLSFQQPWCMFWNDIFDCFTPRV